MELKIPTLDEIVDYEHEDGQLVVAGLDDFTEMLLTANAQNDARVVKRISPYGTRLTFFEVSN